MRTFVKLREMLAAHKELSYKLAELEKKVGQHGKAIRNLFEALNRLIDGPEPKKQKIGFIIKEQQTPYKISKKISRK